VCVRARNCVFVLVVACGASGAWGYAPHSVRTIGPNAALIEVEQVTFRLVGSVSTPVPELVAEYTPLAPARPELPRSFHPTHVHYAVLTQPDGQTISCPPRIGGPWRRGKSPSTDARAPLGTRPPIARNRTHAHTHVSALGVDHQAGIDDGTAGGELAARADVMEAAPTQRLTFGVHGSGANGGGRRKEPTAMTDTGTATSPRQNEASHLSRQPAVGATGAHAQQTVEDLTLPRGEGRGRTVASPAQPTLDTWASAVGLVTSAISAATSASAPPRSPPTRADARPAGEPQNSPAEPATPTSPAVLCRVKPVASTESAARRTFAPSEPHRLGGAALHRDPHPASSTVEFDI
jgi:hypothetical protein